jgi:hypothetical protein
MNNITGKPGELHFTLTITRANGAVENVEMVGKLLPDEEQPQPELGKEAQDGRNPLDLGS